MQKIAYSVDLLFDTGVPGAPGSLHVKVMEPKTENILSAVLEVDSGVAIRNHIDSIVETLQRELFSRIEVDVKNEINMYFSLADNQQEEFDGHRFVKLLHNENIYSFEPVDEIIF